MSSAPSNSIGFQIPETVTFAKEQDAFTKQLTGLYQDLARCSNAKELGLYNFTESLNGQTFPGATPQKKTGVYRKVIECGALPNAANKPVAHGISGIANSWMFTRIYGVARNPTTTQFIPLPDSGAFQVSLMVDATYINIATIANLTAFTYSIVILEYMKA